MSSEHTFLFASLGDKKPTTARKVHIRRLYDLLQLCLQRHDLPRARRAWAILARCKEVDWKTMWTTGVHLLGEDTNTSESNASRLEFLRAMMLQHPEEREIIIKELILRLVLSGRYQDALDELELYLPSFPYQDNPVLHTYAGLICIYLAQPSAPLVHNEDQLPDTPKSFNLILLRDAQAHLEHAKTLDPGNAVANGFLERVPSYVRTIIQYINASITACDIGKPAAGTRWSGSRFRQ
ncbi:hypothetical protein PILCRDRAFT_59492 [Piloderma croceum F 1598]|uniref:ER membrane protein complex subunit 2 n=1 Tax=Piloderma croceum (strain F 1598) TaxID=765440 RepID=A0A0C3CN74_PILCF|nr:hypothetical protein PILCRDRAFT_59492 [Piloderma croceum F 1598]